MMKLPSCSFIYVNILIANGLCVDQSIDFFLNAKRGQNMSSVISRIQSVTRFNMCSLLLQIGALLGCLVVVYSEAASGPSLIIDKK